MDRRVSLMRGRSQRRTTPYERQQGQGFMPPPPPPAWVRPPMAAPWAPLMLPAMPPQSRPGPHLRPCPQCGESVANLQQHMGRIHNEKFVGLWCPVMGCHHFEALHDKGRFRQHLATHQLPVGRQDLEKCIVRVPGGFRKPVDCPVCPFRAKCQEDVEEHRRSQHPTLQETTDHITKIQQDLVANMAESLRREFERSVEEAKLCRVFVPEVIPGAQSTPSASVGAMVVSPVVSSASESPRSPSLPPTYIASPCSSAPSSPWPVMISTARRPTLEERLSGIRSSGSWSGRAATQSPDELEVSLSFMELNDEDFEVAKIMESAPQVLGVAAMPDSLLAGSRATLVPLPTNLEM